MNDAHRLALYELTRDLADRIKKLGNLPEASLPEGFKRARQAWEEASLQLLVIAARGRAPARERAWKAGEELAAVGHDPKQRAALVKQYQPMAGDEKQCFLGGLSVGPEWDGELLPMKGVADGD